MPTAPPGGCRKATTLTFVYYARGAMGFLTRLLANFRCVSGRRLGHRIGGWSVTDSVNARSPTRWVFGDKDDDRYRLTPAIPLTSSNDLELALFFTESPLIFIGRPLIFGDKPMIFGRTALLSCATRLTSGRTRSIFRRFCAYPVRRGRTPPSSWRSLPILGEMGVVHLEHGSISEAIAAERPGYPG